MMKGLHILCVLLLITLQGMAQDSIPPGMVKYEPGYQFRDGLYLNFERVKAGEPIPPARIVSDLSITDRDFYAKVCAEKNVVIYDENGVKEELKTSGLWGYSRNGVLYINVAGSFHRLSYLGNISHFVASITSYNPNYYDPYYYNPYYPGYNPYSNRYGTQSSSYSSTELRQYLLDFETGDVMEYTTESVEVLLMKDPLLSDEFSALRNRKKKQMKFVFIRKYNEQHPLYFPRR